MMSSSMSLFPSELGWIGLVWHGQLLQRVTFGHASPQSARQRLADLEAALVDAPATLGQLDRRLQAFAAGRRDDDFLDVQLDVGQFTSFQRKVLLRCRKIAAGRTLTYSELARQAGYPGAARAAGNVMAQNRWPLVVPCHRVVAVNGLGGFSARSGLRMKKRLLAAEVRNPEPALAGAGAR